MDQLPWENGNNVLETSTSNNNMDLELIVAHLTPGVEVNLAVGGGGAEVGNNVTELDSHFLKKSQSF